MACPTCTADVRQWYLRNGFQLNPDKSEALIIGTTNQLQATRASLSSVTVAGVDLPVANEMKVLGVVLDRRLSFDRHATSVARACNYHVQAIWHIRHLLTTELALTLTCSLILSPNFRPMSKPTSNLSATSFEQVRAMSTCSKLVGDQL